MRFDPWTVRYGRRMDFLERGERMTSKASTTWEQLMDEMRPKFVCASRAFRDRHPDATEVVFFGELFGPGVLTRVNYGPRLGFYGFDIRTGDEWLDFDEMCAIYDEAEILRSAVIGRGTLDEMLALDPTFDTVVGAELGACDERMRAEGMVISPICHALVRGQRCILKHKSELFNDKCKPGSKPRRQGRNYDDESRRACATMRHLVTANRIMDVRSKHPVDITRAQLCREVMADILKDAEFAASFRDARRVHSCILGEVFECYDECMCASPGES